MSDIDFPAGVQVLRPRKVSVSKEVDRFLDEEGFDQSRAPKLAEETRPKAENINSVHCKSCGEVEYLSRVDCRCGHYLRGQLEDEYLAWEQQLHADHKELSELIENRLKPLRFFLALSIIFMLIRLLQLTFWSDDFSLKPLIWIVIALLVGGLASLAEKYLSRPLSTSTWYVENYTFEFFLEDRPHAKRRRPFADQ